MKNKVIMLALAMVVGLGSIDCNAMKPSAKRPAKAAPKKETKAPARRFADEKKAADLKTNFATTLTGYMPSLQELEIVIECMTDITSALTTYSRELKAADVTEFIGHIDAANGSDGKLPLFVSMVKPVLQKFETQLTSREAAKARLEENKTLVVRAVETALAKWDPSSITISEALEDEVASMQSKIDGLEKLAALAVGAKTKSTALMVLAQTQELQETLASQQELLEEQRKKIAGFIAS